MGEVNVPVSRDRYTIDLVGKTFAILEAFDPDHRELSLRDVVERTSQSRSGAFRLLANLERLGILERDAETRRYRIGTRLYALGALAVLDLRRAALPWLERLRDRFDYTVNLSTREGDVVVLVEVLESDRPFRMASSVGSREPLHCTASGKCLLAFAAEPEREALLRSRRLERHTPATIVERGALERELEGVRREGLALDRGEYEPHGKCVAVPLFDRRSAPCGAVSLSGPEELLAPERLTPVADALLEAGARISAELGYLEPYPRAAA